MEAPGNDAGHDRPCRAVVFAPDVTLLIEVEPAASADEIHLHAGGQGYWIARMLNALGVHTTLVGPFGGEQGSALAAVVAQSGITVHRIDAGGGNAVHIIDGRCGRQSVAEAPAAPLTRHEIDALFGAVLV